MVRPRPTRYPTVRQATGKEVDAMRSEPFTLEQTTLEDIAERLGHLYGNVRLSREPMFAWVQIITDVTILGEDLRRERRNVSMILRHRVSDFSVAPHRSVPPTSAR